MSNDNKVILEVRDHIAWVYLNRPEKLNGLDMDMFNGLVAAAKKFAKIAAYEQSYWHRRASHFLRA